MKARTFSLKGKIPDDKRLRKIEQVNQILQALRLALLVSLALSVGYRNVWSLVAQDNGPTTASRATDTARGTDAARELEAFSQLSGGRKDNGDLSIFENRNLFRLTADRSVLASEALAVKSNYRLVGIILDDAPMAIIEDMKKHQTLFLTTDDSLEDWAVAGIVRRGVVFESEGETLELTLEGLGK